MTFRPIFSLAVIVSLCFAVVAVSTPAYAHNFSPDESAAFLAKVHEIPVATHAISVDLGNSTLVHWHSAKLTQYWTSDDSSQLAERNQLLAREISDTISNLTEEAAKPSPDHSLVDRLVANLDGYMSESIPIRIDTAALQNNTVSALAVTNILNEVMNNYGNATGSGSDSMDMSTGGVSGMSMSSGGSMQMSGNATITNFAAYQAAEALAKVAQSMWIDLKSKTLNAPADTALALDSGFAKLIQITDNKQSSDQIMIVVHGTIHPNLISLYNLDIAGHTGADKLTILEKKRIEYLAESSAQRHSEHLAQALPSSGPYKANLNYVLDATGTAIAVGGNTTSPAKPAHVALVMSVFKSTSSVISLDILNGTVTTGDGDMRVVQSGYVYYIPGMHKLIAYGYIPQKQGGTVVGVQLLELWSTMDYASKMPSSQSDKPLAIKIWSPQSKVGSDWEIQASGNVSLS